MVEQCSSVYIHTCGGVAIGDVACSFDLVMLYRAVLVCMWMGTIAVSCSKDSCCVCPFSLMKLLLYYECCFVHSLRYYADQLLRAFAERLYRNFNGPSRMARKAREDAWEGVCVCVCVCVFSYHT